MQTLVKSNSDLELDAPTLADLPEPSDGPTPQPSGWTRVRHWITEERLEAIFTVITFVTMMGGLFVEKVLNDHGPLMIGLYALAYVFGGAFGLKGGLEALRERT
ncbi:MAG: hypothetical protein NZ518_02835, partial [Dehalococcoidia bacterium]|nr:hypothetical protein [Dehalococcoidia bacterium]